MRRIGHHPVALGRIAAADRNGCARRASFRTLVCGRRHVVPVLRLADRRGVAPHGRHRGSESLFRLRSLASDLFSSHHLPRRDCREGRTARIPAVRGREQRRRPGEAKPDPAGRRRSPCLQHHDGFRRLLRSGRRAKGSSQELLVPCPCHGVLRPFLFRIAYPEAGICIALLRGALDGRPDLLRGPLRLCLQPGPYGGRRFRPLLRYGLDAHRLRSLREIHGNTGEATNQEGDGGAR